MASLSNDPGGTRRINLTCPDGKRRPIRLGKISKQNAEELRGLVSRLAAAASAGSAPSHGDALRVADLPDALHAKFAKAGIVAPRERAEAATLGPFLAAYLETHAGDDAKDNTVRHLSDAARHLLACFGPDKPLADVTPADADDFRRFLAKGGRRGRGRNTVNRHVGRAVQFFNHAKRKRLILENPFAEQDTAVRPNEDRDHFVTPDECGRVLAALPSAEWRAVFALARFGGLRVPSELAPLRWRDVRWPDQFADDPRDRAGWLRVTSPKTEHHPGGGSRAVPLFPDLLTHLETLFDEAEPGADDPVLPRFQRPAGARPYNPHTTFKKYVKRSGVKPWPKLFVNLRASAQIDWAAARHPAHVVADWAGNSEAVGRKHYLRTTGDDFARAVGGEEGDRPGPAGDPGGAPSGARVARFAARRVPADSGKEPHEKTGDPVFVGWSPVRAASHRRTPQDEVPGRGLEPPRGCPHWHLKPARLPIPPPGRALVSLTDPRLSPRVRSGGEIYSPAPETASGPPGTNDETIAFDSRPHNPPPGSCGTAVRITAHERDPGSTHITQPVKPQWPNAAPGSRSPKYAACAGQTRRQPSPHGRHRRSASGTCRIGSSAFAIAAATVAGPHTPPPPVAQAAQNRPRSPAVDTSPPHGSPVSRQYGAFQTSA